MRKLILIISALLLVCMFFVTNVFSRVATQQEMDNVSQNWLTEITAKQGTWAGVTKASVITSGNIIDEGRLLARYYNIYPKGFIIVSVLKEMSPVKMYSEKSAFASESDSPFLQLMKDIFNSRYRAYESLYGNLDAAQIPGDQALFDAVHSREWNRLAVPAGEFKPDDTRIRAEAGPLLTTAWHQLEPYNNLCPMGDGGRVVVGCGATAAAQFMNYYQWPPTGVGTHSYYWEGDYSCEGSTPGEELSADYSDVYDWVNMPDNCESGCTQAEIDAVAELCYEIGVAMDMSYGACGSGTSYRGIEHAFRSHFKFNPYFERHYRIDYTAEGWFSLIQDNINSGHPLYYLIHSHAIVCDGWRDDGAGLLEYHMNYGWGLTHGESYDVWYVLDNLYCYWIEGDLCPYEYDILYQNLKPQYDPILQMSGQSSDDAGGDNDGHADPGETVELNVALKNEGNDALAAQGTLTSLDPYITINTPSATFADIPWGEIGSTLTPFEIEVDPSCPDPYWAPLEIEVSTAERTAITEPLCFFIGDTYGLADDVESGEGCWQHKSFTVGFGDEWHLSGYRAYGGSATSWKIGGLGSAAYSDKLDGALVSPPILLPPHACLGFQHWFDVEEGGGGVAWDGAIIMITTGDGQWTQIISEGGYTHVISDYTESAFAPGTPCFSGYQDWTYEEFDLSAYSGEVQIMFRFSSDGNTVAEGWYIDDIVIDAKYICGDVNDDVNINILDIVYLINYKYKSGAAPVHMNAGDVNSDFDINILDIVYLINYRYKSGAEPNCP